MRDEEDDTGIHIVGERVDGDTDIVNSTEC